MCLKFCYKMGKNAKKMQQSSSQCKSKLSLGRGDMTANGMLTSMLTVFFNCQHLVHYEFTARSQTLNQEF